jgi:hypothetical protein
MVEEEEEDEDELIEPNAGLRGCVCYGECHGEICWQTR